MTLRLVADRHKPGSIWRFGPVSWIPFFSRMTAEVGMSTKGTPTDRAIRQNPALINRPGAVSWIPAFAGMTEEGARMTTKIACVCLSRPSSFRRRPACMDAGGRAVSGTKAEESSGLCHTFPPEAGMTTMQAHISANPYSETRVISMESIRASIWPPPLPSVPATMVSSLPGSRSEVSFSVSYWRFLPSPSQPRKLT